MVMPAEPAESSPDAASAGAPQTAAGGETDYDLVIFGGSYSGSALGLLLKRERPDLRILIVEKSERFDRKVGESTSEVAGCFLTRVLGLSNHLAGSHFQKHGLRMWFCRDEADEAGRCSEIGPFSQVRFPTFQLDREILDQHLLELAVEAGCELLRPATVKDFELGGAGRNTVTLKHAGETRRLIAGWIADCSGRAALVARKRGTLEKLEEHPVHSMWVRFRGVHSLDSTEVRNAAGDFGKLPVVARGSATNHLMGRGWWAWIIPLSNGDFSAGVSWDERLFTPPDSGPVGERVKAQLLSHPVGRLMFADAEPVENDARIFKNLPYFSSEVAGDGWICCGDSAGFMDPLYSQGLDYCSHSTYCARGILLKAFAGECVETRLGDHNRQFGESYHRWFRALYRNKYQYLGDARLMRAAFLLDIGTYFVGPVQLVYRATDAEFSKMPYDGPIGAAFARFMALYNRRLERIARKLLHSGRYGRANLDHRFFIRTPFSAGPGVLRHLAAGTLAWLRLELATAFIKPDAVAPEARMQKTGSATGEAAARPAEAAAAP